MKKFWNWIKNEDTGQRELFLEGVIASESWWGDEVTPEIFKEELHAGTGPILLHINSPGGDTVAASMIYTMLMDYPFDVVVQIDGIAASAASVIAMAGTTVRMSPTALMMIHNPWTCAMGDAAEMQRAIAVLDEVKESIINAYQIKTGLSRNKLAELMDSETWMNAHKAKELGFCDEVMYEDAVSEQPAQPDFIFSARAATLKLVSLVNDSVAKTLTAAMAAQPTPEPNAPETQADETEAPDEPKILAEPVAEAAAAAEPEQVAIDKPDNDEPTNEPEPDTRVKADDLMKRLMLLK